MALHRLGRGGAARASHRSKTSSGDGELFPRSTAEEPHAPDAEAEASDSKPWVHVLEPLADHHSSDGEDTPTGVEEAARAVAAAPKRTSMSFLERLQAIGADIQGDNISLRS